MKVGAADRVRFAARALMCAVNAGTFDQHAEFRECRALRAVVDLMEAADEIEAAELAGVRRTITLFDDVSRRLRAIGRVQTILPAGRH